MNCIVGMKRPLCQFMIRQKSCGFGVQKAAATLLASFSILLFFLTQPLVWRIQLFDWWTILFALLTLVVLVLLITCRRDKENAHKYELHRTADGKFAAGI